MPAALLTALIVALACQAPADRSRAEELAKSGRAAEAITLFEQVVEENPADIEARLWIGRLELQLGRTDQAESRFRSVVRERPADVEARIGLGAALTRKGAWREALEVLNSAERDAGENSDLFGALGRAYRRAGDDRRALEYFERATRLAPSDADAVAGFEAVARVYGHSVVFEGFGDHAGPDTNTGSGMVTASVRALERLHLDVIGRVQQRSGTSDALGGGGFLWRAGRATTVGVHAVGGPGNTVLPTTDVSGDVVQYAGVFEIGGSLRRLNFDGANVVAASPVLAWDPGGRWRLDSRYTYSRTEFAASGQTSGDHSILLRETWRGWRRVDLIGAYAYGIESFEQLTADRLGSLGASTIATGFRINTPSLTQLNATWEHQWRSNDTTLDRLTLSITQSFP